MFLCAFSLYISRKLFRVQGLSTGAIDVCCCLLCATPKMQLHILPEIGFELVMCNCVRVSNDENYPIQCYSLAVALEFFVRHRTAARETVSIAGVQT